MNIIELAQECQLIGMRPHMDGIYQKALEKFAELVAAQEREEIAKRFENHWKGEYTDEEIATAIRARGTT